MRLLGIQVKTETLSLNKILETLAAAYLIFTFTMGGLVGIVLSAYVFYYTHYYPLMILYLLWCYFDFDVCHKGGRRSHWVRSWRLWKYLRDYFPVDLVKTTDLDPSKNYIFGYHPHGIMCAGAFCNFATEGTEFSSIFPGIRPYFLTLTMNFWFPFYRDLILSYGACAVSRESFQWILTNEGTGNAVVVVIGGAQEALEAHPGRYCLTLKSRKGFIRLALECGASLVPVFAFGENDIFRQVSNPPGSPLRAAQERFKKLVGFSPAVFYGKGLFSCAMGYIPYRVPIVTVVGSPIPVEQVVKPSQDQVEALHKKYTEALTKLYNDHRDKYGAANIELKVL